MAIGMEVGLGPGHVVLDVDPAALLKKGGRAHVLSGKLLVRERSVRGVIVRETSVEHTKTDGPISTISASCDMLLH